MLWGMIHVEGQQGSGSGAPEGPSSGLSTGAITQLLERALAGEKNAFASLIRVFRSEVQGMALRLVGNQEDAEDIAQETFVRGWSGLSRFASKKPSSEAAAETLGPWLFGITVHLARDLQRKRTRSPRREAAARAQELAQRVAARRHEEPDAIQRQSELRQLIEAALEALPVRLRTVLVLRAFEGLSYAAIATITDVRPATARTQVMQARRALLRILGPAVAAELDAPSHRDDSDGADVGGRP